MKANVPKSFNSLPPREKEAIARFMEDESAKLMDEQEVRLFVQYTKVACSVLHDYFGFGEQRLLTFIGDFKNMRRKHRDASNAVELESELDSEMDKIFKGGFPTDFVEDLQRGK